MRKKYKVVGVVLVKLLFLFVTTWTAVVAIAQAREIVDADKRLNRWALFLC